MKKIDVTKVCLDVISKQTIEHEGWGFNYMVDSELDALRIAYAHRNVRHGVKVEHCPAVNKYMVTVFNEIAKAAGIDGAK